jgi:hypothetical protein
LENWSFHKCQPKNEMNSELLEGCTTITADTYKMHELKQSENENLPVWH